MNKTRKSSFFRMVGADRLNEGEKVTLEGEEIVILQIAERESYENMNGYPVYLCEVIYKEDYEKEETGNEALSERIKELLNKYMDQLEA